MSSLYGLIALNTCGFCSKHVKIMYIAPGMCWILLGIIKINYQRNYKHRILCLYLYQAMKIVPKTSPLVFFFPIKVLVVTQCLWYKGMNLVMSSALPYYALYYINVPLPFPTATPNSPLHIPKELLSVFPSQCKNMHI